MIGCSVLRCTNSGSAFSLGATGLSMGCHEAYVCSEHKALMADGAPWDMEGRYVLMGQDLAPVLQNWSARPSVGSAGFTLTLELAGRIKPVEVFLMPAEARTLSIFIDVANGDER